MNLTFSGMLNLVLQTLRSPREGATTVLSFAPPRSVLWQALILLSILSTLIAEAMALISPAPTTTSEAQLVFQGLVDNPLLLTATQLGSLVVLIFSMHYIGRAFGGTGSYAEALLLVTWLQVITLAIQVVQFASLVILPPLAGLIGLLSLGLLLWLMVNFVAVLHGFQSLGLVFAGMLLSGFGILFALSLIIAILGVAPGTP